MIMFEEILKIVPDKIAVADHQRTHFINRSFKKQF
jgi:hypothetical protein